MNLAYTKLHHASSAAATTGSNETPKPLALFHCHIFSSCIRVILHRSTPEVTRLVCHSNLTPLRQGHVREVFTSTVLKLAIAFGPLLNCSLSASKQRSHRFLPLIEVFQLVSSHLRRKDGSFSIGVGSDYDGMSTTPWPCQFEELISRKSRWADSVVGNFLRFCK